MLPPPPLLLLLLLVVVVPIRAPSAVASGSHFKVSATSRPVAETPPIHPHRIQHGMVHSAIRNDVVICH